ncbi:MAG: hypothetical protein HY778_13305 [Betaproteobacteria bacterium]|nr:hypothetical protein [Betaproteobacteria bacterium]
MADNGAALRSVACRSWGAGGLFLPLLLIATAMAYWPGLRGDFEFDDAINLLANQSLPLANLSMRSLWEASMSGDAGPLGRPLSMLSFALNSHFHGFEPLGYKLANLGIHLVNGALTYVLALLLLSRTRLRTIAADPWARRIVALCATGFWLLHPLHVTSVLYVVQRMTSLSATFTLLGMICWVIGRANLRDGKRGLLLMWIGAVAGVILASLSKEVGILLPLYLLVVEICLFDASDRADGGRRSAMVFFIMAVGIPGVAAAAYAIARPEWILGGYAGRDFTLAERLLTESRVLGFYLQQAIVPRLNEFGIYHDDFVVSRRWADPPWTAFAMAGWAAAVTLAVWLRRRAPVAAFGVLWFVAGHFLESSVFPLELVYEHRNYLPLFGPIFAVAYGLLVWRPRWCAAGCALAATAYVALFGGMTYARALEWSNLVDHAAIEAANHPGSARARHQLGRVHSMLFDREPDEERHYHAADSSFAAAAELGSGDVGAVFGRVMLRLRAGKPVEPELLAEAERRLATVMPPVGNVTHLHSLARCQVTKPLVCRLPDGTVLGLLDAALRNPLNHDVRRADFESIKGIYLAHKMGDWSGAERALLRGVQLDPRDPGRRLQLADLYLAIGKADVAMQHARQARVDDVRGRYGQRIDVVLARASEGTR